MRKKPKIKYTDMCIYIDAHAYEPNHDVEKIYDYLQMLFYALAFKKRFFQRESDYDEYSLFGATKVYMRYKHPNQNLDPNDKNYLPKIKSVLNYIKKLLYPLKVDYEKANYQQVVLDDVQGKDLISTLYSNCKESLYNRNSVEIEVSTYFDSLPKLIWSVIDESPYCNNRQTKHRLYMSCLISFLKSITLSKNNLQRLRKPSNGELKHNFEDLLQEFYDDELITSSTCWNLEPELDNYVHVLVVRIRKLIIKDIQDIIKFYEPAEDIIKDMLLSPVAEVGEDSEE